MNLTLVFQVLFWSFGRVWFYFGGFVVKVAYSFKSQGSQKIELWPQGTDDCQNLRYETLIIVDFKYIEVSSLTVLNLKQ